MKNGIMLKVLGSVIVFALLVLQRHFRTGE